MDYHSAWQLTGFVNVSYVAALVITIEVFFFFLPTPETVSSGNIGSAVPLSVITGRDMESVGCSWYILYRSMAYV